jgi:hypothetical protein
VVRTARKLATQSETPPSDANDPILNAALQVARNNLLSQRGG